MLTALHLLLFAFATSASAILGIYHGQVTSTNVSVNRVLGVTLLNTSDLTTTHFFDCNSTTTHPNMLVWEKEGGRQRFPTTVIPGLGLRLDLAPITGLSAVMPSDLGVYTCVDKRSDERLSISIVEGSVALLPVESRVVSIVGESVELSVYAVGQPPLRDYEVEWIGPQHNLITSGSGVSLHDNNTRLLIQSVDIEDSGTYQVNIVRLISDVSTILTSMNISVELQVGVEVVSGPASVRRLEHESVTLSCTFRGNPPPSVIWERGGSITQLPVASRLQILHSTPVRNETVSLFTVTSEFLISEVLYDDRGRYRCVATNTLLGDLPSRDESSFAELIVTPRVTLTAADPITITDERSAIAHEGFRVVIYCSGSGDKMWQSSAGEDIIVETAITSSRNLYQRSDPINNKQILFIQSFSLEDSAIYTCTTDLSVDGSSIAASVFITSADPAVEFAEHTVYAVAGSTVQLVATVHSSDLEAVVVRWYHDGALIDTSTKTAYGIGRIGSNMYALSVVEVGRGDLGRYVVLVCVGERNDSDTVQLVFPDSVTAVILYEDMPETRVLSIVAEEGDAAPLVSCESYGTPTPSLRWSLQGGLLHDVTMRTSPDGQSVALLWNRPLQYTDSGHYLCHSSNLMEESTARLQLLVRKPPMITSIFPMFPVTYHSSNGFTVPYGVSGTVLTCTAFGWPPPSIEWIRDGVSVAGRISSSSTTRTDSAFVSTSLIWQDGFLQSDAGEYTCLVQAKFNDTIHHQLLTATLQNSFLHPPNFTEPSCSIKSSEISFQLHVRPVHGNITCSTWTKKLKQQDVSKMFSSVLIGVINAAGHNCTFEDITIFNKLTCGGQQSEAVLFTGRITTLDKDRTKMIFCALKKWQHSEPILQIYDQLFSVDNTCDIDADSPAGLECSVTVLGLSSAPTMPVLYTTPILIALMLFHYIVVG